MDVSMLKTLANFFFSVIPLGSPLIMRLAHYYIDRCNGDNNSDPDSNGENYFLDTQLKKFKSGVVFDVGANIGQWSKYCLSVNPDIEMHLFEPSKVTFDRLRNNDWNGHIHLNNFGLGEKSERINLHIAADGSSLNSIHKRSGIDGLSMDSFETVALETLDSYCEEKNIQNINLLKVDVEGHEIFVFKGAKRLLTEKRINYIQFEYGGCNLDARVYLLDIWNYLESLDYKLFKIYPNRLQALTTYNQRLENFQYSNYIACAK